MKTIFEQINFQGKNLNQTIFRGTYFWENDFARKKIWWKLYVEIFLCKFTTTTLIKIFVKKTISEEINLDLEKYFDQKNVLWKLFWQNIARKKFQCGNFWEKNFGDTFFLGNSIVKIIHQ